MQQTTALQNITNNHIKIQPFAGAQETYKKEWKNSPNNTTQKLHKNVAPNGRPGNLQKKECKNNTKNTTNKNYIQNVAPNGRPEKMQKNARRASPEKKTPQKQHKTTAPNWRPENLQKTMVQKQPQQKHHTKTPHKHIALYLAPRTFTKKKCKKNRPKQFWLAQGIGASLQACAHAWT